MPRKPTILKEDIVDSGGNSVPDPVNTGNPHALRPQDNLQGDQNVAHDGSQDISRGAILSALLSKLVGMDGAALSQVATAMSLTVDVVANPLAGTALDGAQSHNLATISTHEDVAELFAGEDLSEEFKAKTQVIFEAAVQARVHIVEAQAEDRVQKIQEESAAKIEEIKETAEREVEASVTSVTEDLVNQIDKYLTFVAEEYVEKNKAAIETTASSVIAEEVLTKIAEIVNRYVVVTENVDPLAESTKKIDELEKALKESLDERIADREALKAYRRKEVIAEAAGALTAMQRGRLEQLAEGLELEDESDFAARVAVLKNSITRKDEAASKVSVITENVIPSDGVPPLADEGSALSDAAIDQGVNSVLRYLQRSAT